MTIVYRNNDKQVGSLQVPKKEDIDETIDEQPNCAWYRHCRDETSATLVTKVAANVEPHAITQHEC